MSKTITALKQISAEQRRDMLDALNLLHYLSETVLDRDAAVAFNKEASGPLKQLQRKFDMPCGKVINLRRVG